MNLAGIKSTELRVKDTDTKIVLIKSEIKISAVWKRVDFWCACRHSILQCNFVTMQASLATTPAGGMQKVTVQKLDGRVSYMFF